MVFLVQHQPLFALPNQFRKRKTCTKNIPIPEISIPGIKNISQSGGKLRKLLWILAIVFCLLIALIQIKERIDHYVNGAIAVRVSVAQDEKINLPYITFCPMASWWENTATQILYSKNFKKFNKRKIYQFDLLKLENVTINHLWSLTQLDLRGILITSWNNSVNDSFDKFFFPSLRGQCVTYRALKEFPSFLLPELTIELTNTGWNFQTPQDIAYKIIIHDNPYLTIYDVGSTGIMTFFKFKSVLKITFTKFSYLNTYKSPCTSDTKLLHECRTHCINQKLSHIITTKLPFHTIPNIPFCSNTEDCINSLTQTYEFFSTFNYDQCNCPRLCQGFVSSTSKYFGEMITNKISFVRIYMLLDDTIIDKIEEFSAYTSVSLLCDVGAILGLMLGTCVLTFIQLCEVLVFFFKRSLKPQNTLTHIKDFSTK